MNCRIGWFHPFFSTVNCFKSLIYINIFVSASLRLCGEKGFVFMDCHHESSSVAAQFAWDS
jgi:hypothetical protein